MNLLKEDLQSIHSLLVKRQVSATDLLTLVQAQIEEVEAKVHAYLHLLTQDARRQAQRADERLKSGENVTLLTGIPLAVKDVICIRDHPTTCGSKILESFSPPYDATVIERLQGAGAVFVGKANMDEFAMGSSTENSAFGVTRNPWDLSRVPGGSSGGSAAAVAAGEALGALGSDTGGSVRQPASFCGIAGLKPTYGLVSRYGLVAFASSLDQIGPMAHTVRDCFEIFRFIAGHDPKDSTSAKVEVSKLPGYEALEKPEEKGLKGVVVGLPREFFGSGLEAEVQETVMKAAKRLERLGARLEEIALPSVGYTLSAYYVLASAEASSNLARYDGSRYGLRVDGPTAKGMAFRTRKEGFGAEVKRRIMLGTYALSAGYYDALYLKAQKVRTLIKQDFDAAFKTCQILLTPTSPTTAFKIGEKVLDPLAMYLSDVYTLPVNLAGICGLSLPAGFSREGLPIGVQLIGPAFGDFRLFHIGSMLEKDQKLTRHSPLLDSASKVPLDFSSHKD